MSKNKYLKKDSVKIPDYDQLMARLEVAIEYLTDTIQKNKKDVENLK